MGVHWKIQFLGWVHENPIYRGEFPKGGGGLGQFAGLKVGLTKKRGCFWQGVDTPIYTMTSVLGNNLTI